jgi:hypothetical protein
MSKARFGGPLLFSGFAVSRATQTSHRPDPCSSGLAVAPTARCMNLENIARLHLGLPDVTELFD